MFAGAYVISDVHQRNGVVVVFFGIPELRDRALCLLIARVQVNRGAVCQFLAAPADHFLEVGLRLVEFVFLHRAQTGLVILHSLCKTRVVADRFLRCGLLCHLQNSSCTLRMYSSYLSLRWILINLFRYFPRQMLRVSSVEKQLSDVSSLYAGPAASSNHSPGHFGPEI